MGAHGTNKQQAMFSTHRDIWWPAWAHQQDRDIPPPPLRSGSQTLHTLNRKMSRREVGQARGVEEGLEQWAHRGAKVGLALERALWVPRPERALGTERTAWAPETVNQWTDETRGCPKGVNRASPLSTLYVHWNVSGSQQSLCLSSIQRYLPLLCCQVACWSGNDSGSWHRGK